MIGSKFKIKNFVPSLLWSVSLSNQPISRSWKYVHIWRHFVTWIKVRRWSWTDPMLPPVAVFFSLRIGSLSFLDQWVSWVHLSDHKWPVLINSRYNNLSLSYGSSFSVNGEPWITARQPKCPRHSYFHFNCSLSLFLEICHIWSIQAILSRENVSFIDFSEPNLEQIHIIKHDVLFFSYLYKPTGYVKFTISSRCFLFENI